MFLNHDFNGSLSCKYTCLSVNTHTHTHISLLCGFIGIMIMEKPILFKNQIWRWNEKSQFWYYSILIAKLAK